MLLVFDCSVIESPPPPHRISRFALITWKISAPSSLALSTYSSIDFLCSSLMTAAMSITLSKLSPSRKCESRVFNFEINFSKTGSWTRSFDPAEQTWPWLNQIASTTDSTAESRSALEYTMTGLFPTKVKRNCFQWQSLDLLGTKLMFFFDHSGDLNSSGLVWYYNSWKVHERQMGLCSLRNV